MKDKNNQQINQRDYDKEPIEIEDNFTIRVFEFTFLIIFDVFIIYLIFYSGVIDWTQGSWHEVFRREMEKSFRFFPVVFGTIIVNIWALFSIFVKNRKYLMQNTNIKQYQKLNEIASIDISDIASIKKGFFPILIKKKGNPIIYIFVIFLFIIGYIALFFFKVFLWIYCFLFLKRKPYFSFTPYIFIFSVKTNSVMNIHISAQDDYRLLDTYFYETKGITLSSVSVCRKITNYYKG